MRYGCAKSHFDIAPLNVTAGRHAGRHTRWCREQRELADVRMMTCAHHSVCIEKTRAVPDVDLRAPGRTESGSFGWSIQPLAEASLLRAKRSFFASQCCTSVTSRSLVSPSVKVTGAFVLFFQILRLADGSDVSDLTVATLGWG
jgi:hypothetical protein